MSIKLFLFTLLFISLPSHICVAGSFIREHRLNEKVTIFSENDGKHWGAMADGVIILQTEYAGIELFGDNLLRLIKYDPTSERILYGSADFMGTVQLACEYEYLAIQNGRIQAFRPPVVLEASVSSTNQTIAATSSNNSMPKEEPKSNTAVDLDAANSHVFAKEEQKTVVDYMQGGTQNPKIDLSIIRTKITENNEPQTEADKMPSFPGGEEKMHQFIRDHLNYPEQAKVLGIQGRVVVRFVVVPNGNVEQVEVLHGLETSCDKEAVRIVELMPRWNPGSKNGKRVPIFFTLPISFFF